MTRLIIAGGRNYRFNDKDWAFLDELKDKLNVSEVLCGGATGADEYGRIWAIYRGIAVRMFPANWNAHGKAAGHIRNSEMAKNADAVVLFPGGKGTESMRKIARSKALPIYEP